MSLYSLTETYSEIYDHRKVEDLFDNLRFIDYMKSEDIEQVVEELVWEFRDYGNTLEEAFEIISFASEDDVICESYGELIEDILYEAATVTRSTKVPITTSTKRSSIPSTGSSKITLGRGGTRIPSGETEITSSNRFDQSEVSRRANRIARIRNANKSVKSRISKLSGPISSVKQSISGSAGGLGRAAMNLGGKVVEKGKAMLKSLLRRGGKAIRKAGKSIETSGIRASQEPKSNKSFKLGNTTFTATTEPGGSKRQAIGKSVKRVGGAIKRMSNKTPPKMSRADYEARKAERSAAARKEVGDAFASPQPTPTKKGPVRASLGNVKPSRALSGAIARHNASAATPSTPTSSTRKYPTEPSGQTTLFTKPVKGKLVGQNVKVPVGGQRKFGRKQKPKPTERTRQTSLLSKLREDYDVDLLLQYISEDLIDAGYAYNIDEAYEIINDLDESTLTEIIYDYIEE